MTAVKNSITMRWLAVVALGLAACANTEPVPAPELRLNPAPKEVYEITITMEDAPTTLEGFVGRVQYNIDNYLDCVPVDYTRSLGGSRPRFERVVPIMFARANRASFNGKIAKDALLNEDYYGQGACRWEITAIQAALDHPHSQLKRLNISDPGALLSGHADEKFCLKSEHGSSELTALCISADGVVRRKKPTDWYFKVTTKARRK